MNMNMKQWISSEVNRFDSLHESESEIIIVVSFHAICFRTQEGDRQLLAVSNEENIHISPRA